MNNSASPAYFCLGETNSTSATSYFVTSTSSAPQVGPCIITNGLVGWWPMNGNSNDSSGSAMNGTANGATLAAGQNGQSNGAYAFNGTNSYISFNSTTPLNFVSTDFTVSAWIKLTTLPAVSAWDDILSSTGYGDWSMGIAVNSAGTGYLRMTKISQVDAPASTQPVPQNTWHFVTAAFAYGYPSSTVSYYLDGQPNGVFAWDYSGQGAFSPATKIIGARNANNSGFFNGSIDDLRVYSRVLSPAEIVSTYAAGAQ